MPELRIDIDDLSVGEVEQIEEETQLSLSAILRRRIPSRDHVACPNCEHEVPLPAAEPDERPTAFIVRAFAYVLGKRSDPDS